VKYYGTKQQVQVHRLPEEAGYLLLILF